MPRKLGKRTSRSEMEKYGPDWGPNPPSDKKILFLDRKGMTAGQIARELNTTSTYVEGVLSKMNPIKHKMRKSSKNELLEKDNTTIKTLIPVKGKIQYLTCPVCSELNPISRANLRLKCPGCGTNLLSVRIKKVLRRNKK